MLNYNPTHNIYAGDDKMRVSIKQTKKQQKSIGQKGKPHGQPNKIRQEFQVRYSNILYAWVQANP